MKPANHPSPKARFQEDVDQSQNSAAAPTGASHAKFAFGKASANATAPSAAMPISSARAEVRMIRRLTLFVLVTALIVSACGRQVTPNPPGTNGTGLSPGFMKIKF